MLIKKPSDIKSSEITSKDLYMSRREFIRAASAATLSTGAALSGLDAPLSFSSAIAAEKFPDLSKSSFSTNEKLNSLKDITTYNNFYELGTDKGDPAQKRQIPHHPSLDGCRPR
jgi:methionine sulfoxide reductase catalytic subunit